MIAAETVIQDSARTGKTITVAFDSAVHSHMMRRAAQVTELPRLHLTEFSGVEADCKWCVRIRFIADYELAADCLISLFDATSKLIGTAGRGKQFSKSDLMEVTGLVHLMRHLTEAARVDTDDAFDPDIEGREADPRSAERALLALNELLLKSVSNVMLARHKKTTDARIQCLDEAFDRFDIRRLHAIVMTFAQTTGVQVEG